ncbi:hypothetical protein RYX36_021895, partial [Vicia faba]
MEELRHSSSIGSRTASSPMKRDSTGTNDSSPLIPENDLSDDDHHSSKDYDRPPCSHFHHLCSYFTNDHRVPFHNSWISMFFTLLLVLAGFSNSPNLCKKDGIVLHCPHVSYQKDHKNPYSSTISWKPCAERRDGAIL